MHSFTVPCILSGLVATTFALPTGKIGTQSKRASTDCLEVGSDADYTTIGDAVSALGDSTDDACINIASGTYNEQVTIDYAGTLTLYGETSDSSTYASNGVLITNSIDSADAGTLDDSSTVNIVSSGVSLYNIDIENGYGEGSQAVALTANADELAFYQCSILGYQDTLYAKAGTQYYSGCLIKGADDYIFGDASAYFSECTIMSNGAGSITANSREESDDTAWYVFDSANVTSDGSDLEGEVYLGRPWRVLARVMFQNSVLSDIINAEGWTTMADGATPLYYEYNNSGDGSDTSDRLYETDADGATSIETVLGSDYASWAVVGGTASSTSSSTASTSSSVASASATISNSDSSAVSSTSTTSDASACTPSAGGSSSTDDTPAIQSAISDCAAGTIVIPAGTTYYLNTALDFSGCDGCDFQLEGTLQVSDDLDYWEGLDSIIAFSDLTGAKFRSVTGTGVIDGNGQAAWDKFADDEDYQRPTLFVVDGGSDLTISGFSMLNPPNVFHSVSGDAKNVLYSNLNLSAISTSDNDAKNTDAWDIGASSYVTVTDVTVLNDDDCVAFKPGCTYATVTNIQCTGSHGLSVGSLGKENADSVANIYVSNATMINSAKAVGIKTYPGGYGSATVTNVTYSGVVVDGCDYAIQIQSCYGVDDDDYCDSNPGSADLEGIVFENFSGTTSDKYDPATSNIDCGADGTCDITISGYTVNAPSGDGEVLCANTPSSLGVDCTDGASG